MRGLGVVSRDIGYRGWGERRKASPATVLVVGTTSPARGLRTYPVHPHAGRRVSSDVAGTNSTREVSGTLACMQGIFPINDVRI